MTTSTIVLIVVVAVAAILLIAAIAWVARNKRNQHRHVEAGNIRDKAAEQSHEVGQREALADETAAKARVAQAEADAKAAQAAGLQHQAQARRSDAATARDEVNQEFERADKIDPDSQTTRHTAKRLRNPRYASRNLRRQARPTIDAQSRVTSRTPDARTWSGHRRSTMQPQRKRFLVPAVRRSESAEGCVSTSHATSAQQHRPDDSSGRLGATPQCLTTPRPPPRHRWPKTASSNDSPAPGMS